jgi:uncharacterized membrane protein YkoI
MHLRSFLPAATLLAALTLYPVRMWAEDEEANLNDLPAAVQKTAHEQVGKNSVEEVEDTYEGGQHATEVEFREDGKKMAVVIAKDGTLIQKEYRMSPADAPDAIKKAVAALYPGGKISHIKQVTRGGTVFFELSVKTAGGAHQLTLDPAGKKVAG